MRARAFVIVILLAWAVVGCVTVTPPPLPEPTMTPTSPPKRPAPSRPRIGGEISGVPGGTLVTVHIRTLAGWEARTVKGPFPGLWESIVTEASGVDYIVTAEAEGYVSHPISYTIHLSGTMAYAVEDSQITSSEALHLDFYFKPVDSP